MGIKYDCPKCKARLENAESMGGKYDECPLCNHSHTVPLSKKQQKQKKKAAQKKATSTPPSVPANSPTSSAPMNTDPNTLTVMCSCGEVQSVSRRLVGRQGKCPQCGATNRISDPNVPIIPPELREPVPAEIPVATLPDLDVSEPKVSASPEPMKRNHVPPKRRLYKKQKLDSLAIVLGGLMLATFFIPWAFVPSFDSGQLTSEAVMAWDLLSRDGFPGGYAFLLVLAWFIGPFVVAVACSTRGRPVALTMCVTGGIWVLVCAILSIYYSSMIPGLPGFRSMKALIILSALYNLAVCVSMGFSLGRISGGQNRGLSVLRAGQAISSILGLLLLISCFVLVANLIEDIPNKPTELMIGLIIWIGLQLLGVGTALVHAVGSKVLSSREYGRVSILSFVVCGGVFLVYAFARMSMLSDSTQALLPLFNMVLILVGAHALFVIGLSKSIVHMDTPRSSTNARSTSRGNLPKPSSQDSESVEERMRMLHKLHQDGIITNEELAVKKADVLSDL